MKPSQQTPHKKNHAINNHPPSPVTPMQASGRGWLSPLATQFRPAWNSWSPCLGLSISGVPFVPFHSWLFLPVGTNPGFMNAGHCYPTELHSQSLWLTWNHCLWSYTTSAKCFMIHVVCSMGQSLMPVHGTNSIVKMYQFYLPILVDGCWVVSTFRLFIMKDVVTFREIFS